jgi:hypothetical protein
LENGGEALPRSRRKATSEAHSGEELWAIARRTTTKLVGLGKGDAWGHRLMKLAHDRPSWVNAQGSPEERPMVRAVREAVRSVVLDYPLSEKHGPLIIGSFASPSARGNLKAKQRTP